MPAKLEPISKLNYAWPKGENDWNLGMDENLRRIGVLLQNGVESHTVQVPASPVVGKLYIVPPSATGAWAGKSGQIATWEPSAWFFVEPRDGMIMYNVTTKDILVYIGATWVSVVETDASYAAFRLQWTTFKTAYDKLTTQDYISNSTQIDLRTPKWYLDTYGVNTKYEFVLSSLVGVTPSAVYGTMQTMISYTTNLQNGFIKQVYYINGRLLMRQSTSDTAWSTWTEFESNMTPQIQDTRNDNRAPEWYWVTYPQRVVQEFKGFNIGLAEWSTVTTFVPNNTYGSKHIKQIARTTSGKEFIRTSLTATTWDVWIESDFAGKIGGRNFLLASNLNLAAPITGGWVSNIARTKADVMMGYSGPLVMEAEFYFPTAAPDGISAWLQVGGAGLATTNIIPTTVIPVGTKGLYRLSGVITVPELTAGAMTVSMRMSGTAYTGLVLQNISLQRGSKPTDWVIAQDDLGSAALAALSSSKMDRTVGGVVRVGDWGLGAASDLILDSVSMDTTATRGSGFFAGNNLGGSAGGYSHVLRIVRMGNVSYSDFQMPYGAGAKPNAIGMRTVYNGGAAVSQTVYSSLNPIIFDTGDTGTGGKLVTVASTGELKSKGFTVDANGFYKSASPIVRLYADHIELNDDASHQDITFERVSVGHYLVKGSSGFATDGWWFNVPVDSNGNKIVVSTHETLDDGTLSIKTYKRKFDIETASIVPDLDNPVDIPANSLGESRWIDIRLIEIDLPPVEDHIPLDPDDDVTESAE